MRNSAGGQYNHDFFWKYISSNKNAAFSGGLAAAITDSFEFFNAFKTQQYRYPSI
jgi:superoxide dismutase, Fe-Mn family